MGLKEKGSSGILNFPRTSPIGFILDALAISISDLILVNKVPALFLAWTMP